jgi:hypothetical protein
VAKFIAITIDGETTVARLHEEAAPTAVARFWEALPIEQTLRHVRWSGMASYVLVDALRDEAIPLENRVSFYQPGAICLRPEHGEVAFSYGQAQARDHRGNNWAAHIATVEGDTAGYMAAIARTKRGGARPITITRREG